MVVPGPSAAGAGSEPEPFDITFESSGSEFGVTNCINSLDIGGRAVLAGSVATSPDLCPRSGVACAWLAHYHWCP